MTANVSFYLTAILAQCVESQHSLQERNVLGNVLIVDHHVKKIYYRYIYSLGRLERLYNTISDKNKTYCKFNLVVTFKKQN